MAVESFLLDLLSKLVPLSSVSGDFRPGGGVVVAPEEGPKPAWAGRGLSNMVARTNVTVRVERKEDGGCDCCLGRHVSDCC